MTIDDIGVLTDPNTGQKIRICRCLCSCGSIFHATESDIDSGAVQSCGHQKARRDSSYFVPRLTLPNRLRLIRDLAYALWQEAGSPVSDGVPYWLEAQKRVNKEPPQPR